MVHEVHECSQCIRQTERHNKKLVVSLLGRESCLHHIELMDLQLKIPRPEIYLGEHTRSLQLIKKVNDFRQGILVLDGYLVQLPIKNLQPTSTK